MPDHVVAANIIESLHSMLKSITNINLYEAGQANYVDEKREELPPYESVSADTFVVQLEELQARSCCHLVQAHLFHSSSQVAGECPVSASYDDLCLFPTNLESSSDEHSSVVTCFTDELSCNTQSGRNSSCHLSTELPLSSSHPSKISMLERFCQDSHEFGTNSTTRVADWLCNVDVDNDGTDREDTSVTERPNSTNVDEQKDGNVEALIT